MGALVPGAAFAGLEPGAVRHLRHLHALLDLRADVLAQLVEVFGDLRAENLARLVHPRVVDRGRRDCDDGFLGATDDI